MPKKAEREEVGKKILNLKYSLISLNKCGSIVPAEPFKPGKLQTLILLCLKLMSDDGIAR